MCRVDMVTNIVGIHLESGSDSECEIRGCSICAIEVIVSSIIDCRIIMLIITIADPKETRKAHI